MKILEKKEALCPYCYDGSVIMNNYSFFCNRCFEEVIIKLFSGGNEKK